MRKTLSTGAVILLGLLTFQSKTSLSQEFHYAVSGTDPRLLRLQEFFAAIDSPAAAFAGDFIMAADVNHLDWRLLPGIAFVETGGGKAGRKNNFLGWDQGNREFGTVSEGIHFVATRLKNSKLYKNKPLRAVLQTYNKDAHYTPRVMSVMATLGPVNLSVR